jgi:selenocysteine lyase/cysteine desulfurase
MDVSALRTEMRVTDRWVYFDHAAIAPITSRAQLAMNDWASDIAQNGEINEPNWNRSMEEVRAQAGRLLDADPLDIAFIKNTSEGIGIVAEGFPWNPGDNVVSSAEEYPANIYPWLNLAHRGVEVRRVASRGPCVGLDDLRSAMDGRTRLITLSMVEYSSGFRNDLEAIGALCRQRGSYLFVDAIQGLGVLPLSVRQTPIDFLSADGHKWLLGPPGAGLLYVRRELIDMLHPVGIGWNSVVNSRDFSRIDFRLKPHAGRWESGALNAGAIMGLGASLGLLLEMEIERIADRVLELTDYLCDRASSAGLGVFSSRRGHDKSGIVSLTAGAVEPRQIVRQCRQEGIVINHRAGRLRVSPHCYNTREEIDRFLAVVRTMSGHG